MTTYGLIPEGFLAQPLVVIREAMEADLRTAFGQSILLGDTSVFGQIVGIMAERYAILWELAEAVYNSQNPDAATGTALIALCALTGTLKDPAVASSTTLQLTGTPGTVILTGSRASTLSTGAEFATDEDTTIQALTAWASTTGYTIGQQRTNGGNAYVVITSGTSAGSGGPLTTADDITDGTVHWRFIGIGTGSTDVAATCTETGPTVALSGDITVIETPVSGWAGVRNLLDAEVGQDEDTDEELRTKREDDLARAGTSTPDAIRSALLDIEDVTSVTVFYNPTDSTDADGVPPHSVEALVRGGADQDIYDAILANVAAGIGTYGTETGSAEDSEGVSHVLRFSRPEEVDIYVDIVLIKNPDTYPTDGDTQVKAAIVAYGDAQACGKNAVSSSIGAQAFTVTGVLEVSPPEIGIAPAPTLTTTIQISTRQLAIFDTSRITVATSDGTP